MKSSNSSAPKSSSARRGAASPLPSTRSVITNGRLLGMEVDARSSWMRRLRDLMDQIRSDLGGEDAISTAELVLVRRAAMLTIQAELQEKRFADGGGEASPHQIETYGRLTNTLRRTLEALGLARRAIDVTPRTGDATARIVRAIEERAHAR